MGRILVTAATGRVGSRLTRHLAAEGHQVLALTSRESAAPAIRNDGATPVVADIREPHTLGKSLTGLDALFLATADDPRQDRIEQSLIETVGAIGRPHVVKLSAQSAGLDPPVSFGALHRQSELSLEQSGLPFTILRPTFFQQSLLLFASDIISKGRIIAPAGNGRIAMVNAADVAKAAAAVACNQAHFGKIYTLTGPSAHSFGDITARLSQQLGTPVGFTSPPTVVARLVMPLMTGMPRWKSNLLIDLLSALRAGAQERISDDFERITGQPPSDLETFLDHHIASFRA